MNTQDLIALAKKHGALVLPRLTGEFVTFAESEFVTFCAALSAAQPKADERGSAAPEFIAAYMASCSGRDADHNEIGLHYFRAGWNARHPDSAQARDAVQAVELTEADLPSHPDSHVMKWSDCERHAILEWGRAVLAKNGLGGKQ
jgi:hypothetical protein